MLNVPILKAQRPRKDTNGAGLLLEAYRQKVADN
jgi:hypothetical protein